MLRRVFAIYMVLVMGAGPSLCCCSLTHLFAAHAGPQKLSPSLPPCCQGHSDGDHQHGEGCCPHEKRDGGQRDEDPKPACPCRQLEPRDAAVPDRAVEMPDQAQVASPLLDPFLAVAFDDPLGVSEISASPGGPPPFLTADDLLRVHHQLRC